MRFQILFFIIFLPSLSTSQNFVLPFSDPAHVYSWCFSPYHSCAYNEPCRTGNESPQKHHSGIDYVLGNCNDGYLDFQIHAPADGKVVNVYNNLVVTRGLGKVIILEHSLLNGIKIYTLYGHLSSIGVNSGDSVYKGEVIGTSGNTATSSANTAPRHLHYEVKTLPVLGSPINQYVSPGYMTTNSDQWGFYDPNLTFLSDFNFLGIPHLISPTGGIVNEFVTFDWSDIVGANNYRIQIKELNSDDFDPSNGFDNPDYNLTTNNAISEMQLTLDPGKLYFWTVKSGNDNTGSYFSPVQSFYTEGQTCNGSRSSNSSCIDLKLPSISTNANLFSPGSSITINTVAELVPPNASVVNGTLVYNLINTSTNQIYFLGDDNFSVGNGTATDAEAITVNLPNVGSGHYTIQITIDPSDQILEFNEDNNQIEKAIVIIENPGDPPENIILNAQVSPTTAQSSQTLTASGTAIYDNGDPVDFETVTIQSQGQTWTVNTNANGAFSRQISAPQNSSNVNFSINDGNFTASDQVYINIQQNNNGGPYNPHFFTVCRYVNGSGWSDPTTHVKTNFSRVYIWEEYINVNVPIRTRTSFYKPDGVKYFHYVGDWSPGNGGDWLNWVYMDVSDEIASDWQGTWQVKIETQEQGQGWVVTKNLYFILSHLLAEQRMCKDVNPTSYAPIGPTNNFTQDDNMAVAWNKFTDISNELEVRAEWVEPNGATYEDLTYTIDDPGWETNAWYPTIFQWNYILIKNNPAANKTGCWKVNIYTKDPFGNWDFEYEDNFKILESPNVAPQANVNATQAQFIEGQNVRFNISASDNTYLKELIFHWFDGTWHQNTWSDINANSKVINNFNLGSYGEGVSIDYYVEAWDNSGNHISSAWKNLVIQDSDVSPPQISNFIITDMAGNDDGVLDDEDEHLLASFELTDPSGIDEVRFFLDGVEMSTINAYEVDLGQVHTGQHFVNIFTRDGDDSPESELYSFTFNVVEFCQGEIILNAISDSEYKSGSSIETSGSVILESNQSVILRSNQVKLKSGYHAKPGSVMEIKVDPCIQSN